MIINHVSVGTNDISAAIRFYDAVFATLGIQRSHVIDGVAASYGESFEFWVGSPCHDKPTSGNGSHFAFTAPTTQSVDEFYQVALKQGGRCGGKPGLRPQYGKSYYAAYIYDLDGNKIEAVSC
ncbi:VOC family protein [Photobacterium alginatilyticum]|uniref:VOC family protein n=1 Tax=Photobacterium alginatilyticum TaxID=1775171 RepID=A0ABW9YHB6_9GAMM|nr:VOC family protein [Photobacterium alginatilyticum]